MRITFDFNEDELYIHIDTERPFFCCLQTMEEAFKDLTEIYHCTVIIDENNEEKLISLHKRKPLKCWQK